MSMAANENRNSLEALQARKDNADRRIKEYNERMKRCEEQSKLLSKRIDDLNRKQRTHRLCVRAGMLESFFTKPELLTDDQVMDVLRLAFRQPEVKKFVAGIEASLPVLQDGDLLPDDAQPEDV